MDTCVDFESRLFAPFLSEEGQVNPQVYGAELAWWLSRELAQEGVETSYPNSEDWGWFIEYIVDDHVAGSAVATKMASKINGGFPRL